MYHVARTSVQADESDCRQPSSKRVHLGALLQCGISGAGCVPPELAAGRVCTACAECAGAESELQLFGGDACAGGVDAAAEADDDWVADQGDEAAGAGAPGDARH